METAMDRKYFPHFKQEMVDVGDGVSINALAGGQGKEALLLLHGHPETHLIWRFMAEQLAEKYFVVLADMRGYGDSSKPVGLPDHSNYSKRVMAQDMIRVMNHFGFQKFHAVGHDRGARVLHRLVLDAPETVWSCTLMDILPTYDMYADTNEEFATKYWHWFFYIQGNGFPERLLAADPDYFIHYNLNLKIGPAARENFPEEVLQEYTRCFAATGTIHGIAEDYRASAGIDREYDKQDVALHKQIDVPLLVLWGADGVVGHLWDVKAGWEKYSHRLQAYGIPKCGHFVPEEQPGVVLSKLTSFLEDVSAGRI
jgi:haloacetate dehalogenase